VSLLERFGRRHLHDRQFARIWTTGGGHPHLEQCAACRVRFDDFDRWAVELGEQMRDEADAAFTPDRLAVQQAHIAHRLETLDRPTRVIAFPKAARAVISGHSHVRRWVTVAAAASLIAGFGLGQVVDLKRTLDRDGSAAAPRHFTTATTAQRANAIRPVSTSYNDEEFLMDAEAIGPRVKELRALDDLTPRARDLIARK